MSRAGRAIMLSAIFVLLPLNPLSAAYLFVLLALLSNLTAIQRIVRALNS
jgi:hypothetical protein